MKEVNQDILKKAIAHLPEQDPEAYLWQKIESFLDFDAQISQTTPTLPEYEPEEKLWGRIVIKLGENKNKVHSIRMVPKTFLLLPHPQSFSYRRRTYGKFLERPKKRIITYSLASAAAILISFFGWQLWFSKKPENITISYAVAQKKLIDSLPAPSKTVKDSENYIRLSCYKEPARCESPEISSLKEELENLNQQYSRLNAEAEHYGNDDNIMKAYTKIEATKSRIMKKLISKLKS